MLLEYMGDVDDKLFKEYCDGKNFNSFLNEFDCATNEEDKEKTSQIIKRDEKQVGRMKIVDTYLN